MSLALLSITGLEKVSKATNQNPTLFELNYSNIFTSRYLHRYCSFSFFLVMAWALAPLALQFQNNSINQGREISMLLKRSVRCQIATKLQKNKMQVPLLCLKPFCSVHSDHFPAHPNYRRNSHERITVNPSENRRIRDRARKFDLEVCTAWRKICNRYWMANWK